jgi:CheY-like chemotaxis protein
VSVATANLLSGAGKEHWVTRREEIVVAKGIGAVVTYWLVAKTKPKRNSTKATSESSGKSTSDAEIEGSHGKAVPKAVLAKHDRLISWSTDLLLGYVQTIASTNEAMAVSRDPSDMLVYSPPDGKTCLDEVVEVIKLPNFDAEACLTPMDLDTEISPVVAKQLRDVVTTIANTYLDNPFHNFEHACHVTMSVEKFITRIVTPADVDENDLKSAEGRASILHDYTHGINSDPLTLFAIVFSALIHDTDHRGVSNVQLCKEDETMASLYKSKSVAEQNSLDIAWDVLMSEEFKELRATLFATRADLLRFRQVIVNNVLATDIFDKELNDLRKNRWDRAFGDDEVDHNLRATIVIEHIMQASDVSHTMQHWDVYRKWNYKLFVEMRTAYKQGRLGADPSKFWYKGELGFFDNYIIPLAKKLKDCNIFGASSDECLTFALQNRQEWETRGEAIVASMTQKIPAASMKVLVAEDNAINQKLLLRILNRLGINNVVVVDNGQKAVDKEAAEAFDVVLMDMRMPVMDGVEACELIMKRQGGHPIATVAFVTAHVSEEFKAECLKAGASDFVSKPFNIRDIERCLQKLQAAEKPEENDATNDEEVHELKRLGSDVGNIERKPSIGAKVATDAQNLSAATFNLPGNRRSSIGLGLGLG